MLQSSLWLHQLARALDERFVPHVHRDDDPDQDKLRSRGLAAMAAHMVAGISDREAGCRVTDYYDDDGIDGFAVGEPESGPPTQVQLQTQRCDPSY